MNQNFLHLEGSSDPDRLHLQFKNNNEVRIAAVQAGLKTEDTLQLSGDHVIDANLQSEASKTLGIVRNWTHLTVGDEEGTTYLLGGQDKKGLPNHNVSLLVTLKPEIIDGRKWMMTHKLQIFGRELPADVQTLLDEQAADKDALKAIVEQTKLAEAEARRAQDQVIIEAVTASNPKKLPLKAALGRAARQLVAQPPTKRPGQK